MKNTAGSRLLRQVKKHYSVTWPEIAKSLGISVSRVQDMYSGNYKVPHYYVYMLQDFLDDPEKFNIYKSFKHKDL